MKRFTCIALALLFTMCALPRAAHAAFDPESVSTPHIVLMDADTGNLLYEKASTEQAFPASTTKIMTCILALELCESPNEIVTVGDVVEDRGSTANIVRGEQMPLIDMLYGVMLRSGNDAARAVAEHFGDGSESAFVDKMNQKAAELGMTNTHFVKSNGLHKDDHYTTAYDMAILTQYALRDPTFRTIVAAPTHFAQPTNKDSDGYDWTNTNRLLYTPEDKQNITYPYAIGVKTGDTAQAGRCLVAAAEKDGTTLILVLFGDMEGKVSAEYRFENAAKFFDWGFENYAALDANELDLQTTMDMPCAGAMSGVENVTLYADLTGVRISGLRDDVAAIQADPSKITSTTVLEKTLAAPLPAGETVGTIYYKYDGKPLFSANLVTLHEVAAPEGAAKDGPAASPILIDGKPVNNETKDHAWLFWALVCFVLLVAIVLFRVFTLRNSRRRSLRRRRSGTRMYRR